MKISLRGELVPSNREAAANLFACRWLCRTFMKNVHKRNQYLMEKRTRNNWKWEEGEGFPVDTEQKAEGIPSEAQLALNYINNNINSPIGRALKLNGYLNIILEGRAGVIVYNVHIEDNKVMYRESPRSWELVETLPPPPDKAISLDLKDIENSDNKVSLFAKKTNQIS